MQTVVLWFSLTAEVDSGRCLVGGNLVGLHTAPQAAWWFWGLVVSWTVPSSVELTAHRFVLPLAEGSSSLSLSSLWLSGPALWCGTLLGVRSLGTQRGFLQLIFLNEIRAGLS